tara:strand:- start:14892 stop:15371 length:480 start_codon:yes stop_codon:yes gene_type:complete
VKNYPIFIKSLIPITLFLTSFSFLSQGQETDSIFSIHEMECLPLDSCERSFFVLGKLAEKLIIQKRRKFQNHLYILKIDQIEGIEEKVRIQLCEGAGNLKGGGYEELGCWPNFKKRKVPLNSNLEWGLFVHVYSAQSPLKKIINNDLEEEIVRKFLKSL